MLVSALFIIRLSSCMPASVTGHHVHEQIKQSCFTVKSMLTIIRNT